MAVEFVISVEGAGEYRDGEAESAQHVAALEDARLAVALAIQVGNPDQRLLLPAQSVGAVAELDGVM